MTRIQRRQCLANRYRLQAKKEALAQIAPLTAFPQRTAYVPRTYACTAPDAGTSPENTTAGKQAIKDQSVVPNKDHVHAPPTRLHGGRCHNSFQRPIYHQLGLTFLVCIPGQSMVCGDRKQCHRTCLVGLCPKRMPQNLFGQSLKLLRPF